MSERNDLHPIERRMLELEELERAGVFDRTPIQGNSAETSTRVQVQAANRSTPVLLRLGWRWMPIAAAIALAMGVWGWMFSRELTDLKSQRGVVEMNTLASAQSPDAFPLDCLTGPGESASDRCRAVDFDADGRITMADHSHFLLKLASSSH